MSSSAANLDAPPAAREAPKETPEESLVKVASLAELRAAGSQVVKLGRKQIVLFHGEKGVYACNNRCPHEGYPLKEGKLTEGCILTCNWHNWKFDLEGGETLIGGDKLRRYPVEIRGDEIWLDVTDPPAAERAEAAMASLKDCFGRMDQRMEYDRMAREVARLQRAGADPLDAIRAAIGWTHARFEYGTTHAIAAAADWLALRDRAAKDPVEELAPLTEILGHLAWDSLRMPAFPFPTGIADYSPAALVAAIEAEDETRAIALLRGALQQGLTFTDLEGALAEAALAHYADFGHSLIYVYKTGQLIERLGPDSQEQLLLALVRSLVYAFREDLIPEFRGYAANLAQWDGSRAPARAPRAEDFHRLGIKDALACCRDFAGDPAALYDALLGAAGWSLLHFDLSVEAQNDKPVSQNAGWLDFTHTITFANAVRVLCTRHPRLWPQGLLQIACFLGRNAGYIDADQDVTAWRPPETGSFFAATDAQLFDHGQFEYIVSAHWLKLATAIREEVTRTPDADFVPGLLAALNRVLHSPIKRKFTLRSARQSLAFVEIED